MGDEVDGLLVAGAVGFGLRELFAREGILPGGATDDGKPGARGGGEEGEDDAALEEEMRQGVGPEDLDGSHAVGLPAGEEREDRRGDHGEHEAGEHDADVAGGPEELL